MSLTSSIRNKNTPISQFLRSTFPNTRAFLAEARKQVRQAGTIRPDGDVPWDTIGTAIDYRIRYYFGMTPSEKLAAHRGALILSGRKARIPVSDSLSYTRGQDKITFFNQITGDTVGIFTPSLNGLVGFGDISQEQMAEMYIIAERIIKLEPYESNIHGELAPRFRSFFQDLDDLISHRNPVNTRLDRPDEDELNRYCIVLAELDKVVRAGYKSSILRDALSPVDLVKPAWVEDLTELSYEFYEKHGHLLSLDSLLNPTFDGSADVGGADADLIVNGTLMEIKTTIREEIKPEWIWQLLGYALLNYNNAFEITGIGLYMARQGLLFQWNLEEVLQSLSGQAKTIDDLRIQFRDVAIRQQPSTRSD